MDQEIANGLGNVDLFNYYTSAQTDSLFYPRTELDSLLTATLHYFAVSANGSFESLVRTNVTPPMIKALLPRARLAANTILSDTTLELTCDA